jgi:hypothetical protein
MADARPPSEFPVVYAGKMQRVQSPSAGSCVKVYCLAIGQGRWKTRSRSEGQGCQKVTTEVIGIGLHFVCAWDIGRIPRIGVMICARRVEPSSAELHWAMLAWNQDISMSTCRT